jgi:phospholipid/cholesterol/gamma-HCH transport system substrate-binding protein
METRANFALIGFFTLGVIAAAFLFVWWAAGRDTRAQLPYRIQFSGSVSGLSRGSFVLYNGLKIGEVTSIALSSSDPGKVIAWISVEGTTPINEDTRARLEFQGLTGVASIQMTGGTPNSKRLIVEDVNTPPIIIADRSDFQDLLENAQRLSRRADEVLGHAERIFADSEAPITETVKNIQSFSRALTSNPELISSIVSSTARATESIADVSVKTGELVDRLNKAADRLDSVLAGAQTAFGTGEIKGSITEIGDAARSIRELANHLDTRTADMSDQVSGAVNESVRQFGGLAVDARKALAELERTLREFRQNPQQLITGSKPSVPAYAGH